MPKQEATVFEMLLLGALQVQGVGRPERIS